MICPRHGEWRAMWHDECPKCKNERIRAMLDSVQFGRTPFITAPAFDLESEIARANAAHLRAIMVRDEQSVGFTIPVSVREIDESTSGWPFRKS